MFVCRERLWPRPVDQEKQLHTPPAVISHSEVDEWTGDEC